QFTQMIFRAEKHTEKTGPRPTQAPSPVTDPATSSKQELPRLVKTIPQRKIDAYSGVRFKSIHTDEDWARAKGFRAPLVQAMMSTAYVSEMMTRLSGEKFVTGGTIAMAFVTPVYAG